MDEAVRVRRAERREQLEPDAPDLARGQRAAHDRRAQRFALEQLHREVELARGVAAGIEDLDDAGMPDRVARARFAEKPPLQLRVAGELGAQHLERDPGAGELVMRAQHDAHAAAAEHAVDLVAVIDDASTPGGGVVGHARMVRDCGTWYADAWRLRRRAGPSCARSEACS